MIHLIWAVWFQRVRNRTYSFICHGGGGGYLEAMVSIASEYITRQATQGVMEQKGSLTKFRCSSYSLLNHLKIKCETGKRGRSGRHPFKSLQVGINTTWILYARLICPVFIFAVSGFLAYDVVMRFTLGVWQGTHRWQVSRAMTRICSIRKFRPVRLLSHRGIYLYFLGWKENTGGQNRITVHGSIAWGCRDHELIFMLLSVFK